MVFLVGSGATDILYFNANSFHIFLNQSGNGFSTPITIATALDFPAIYHFIFKNNFNAFTLVP
jgi:hypothetical protein